MSDSGVCAVVVTFNRKNLLLECLESLRKQSISLDSIYVIDNASSDGTGELLLENGYIGKLSPMDHPRTWSKCYSIYNFVDCENIDLHYVRLAQNTGGAGGFYEGVKRAYEDGYDWLWLMDDDAEPVEDALEKLSKYFNAKNVAALASVVMAMDNKISPYHRKFADFNSLRNFYLTKIVDPELIEENEVLDIDDASFVGILINRRSIKEVGFPKKEFFIHNDDTEYCIRLRETGRILLIRDSTVYHKEFGTTNCTKKNFLGQTFNRLNYENYWISYYYMRNNICLLKKYRVPYPYFLVMLLGSWFVSVSAIILLDDHKLKRIRFVTSAYADGFKGNFDNKKPKEILYS